MSLRKLPFSWSQRAEDRIADPQLSVIIRKLGDHVNNAIDATKRATWDEHFQAVLEVCRKSQHLRLHVGDMSRMEDEARDLVRKALEAVINSFCNVGQISPDYREEYGKAIQNILERHALLDKPQPITLRPTPS